MYFMYKACFFFFCRGSKLSNSNDGKFRCFFFVFCWRIEESTTMGGKKWMLSECFFFCFGLVWRWSSDVFLCWDTLQLAAYKGMPNPPENYNDIGKWPFLFGHTKSSNSCLSNQSCLFSGVYCFQIFFSLLRFPSSRSHRLDAYLGIPSC